MGEKAVWTFDGGPIDGREQQWPNRTMPPDVVMGYLCAQMHVHLFEGGHYSRTSVRTRFVHDGQRQVLTAARFQWVARAAVEDPVAQAREFTEQMWAGWDGHGGEPGGGR